MGTEPGRHTTSTLPQDNITLYFEYEPITLLEISLSPRIIKVPQLGSSPGQWNTHIQDFETSISTIYKVDEMYRSEDEYWKLTFAVFTGRPALHFRGRGARAANGATGRIGVLIVK